MENQKDLKPLSEEEIKNELIDLPGWEHENSKITKTFQFRSFSDAVGFVNELVMFWNKIDHHPDIFINYKKITFSLTRYSIGGKITQHDFIVANKIDDYYKHYELKKPE